MKTKTRYREPNELAEKIADEIPPSEKIPLNDQPAADTVKPPNEALAEATDEATRRLQHQLAQLQHSEQLQRQAATMPRRPVTRDEKLTAWRQGGMSEADERFLAEHPAMIDHHQLTAVAAHQAAQQGHERGTDDHRRATKEFFDQHLARLQVQPAAESPEFFRPPPPPEPPSRASIVSAPVSRGEVGGYREPSPSSVKLTPDELEIARASGISPVEYARNKIRMQKEQRSGDRQR